MQTRLPRAWALAALLPVFALGASTPAHAFPGFGPKSTWVDLYGGWASQNGGHLYARLHTGAPPKPDSRGENGAEKLLKSIEALELDAAKGATALIAIQGKGTFKTVADDHGFVDFALPAGMRGPLNRVTLTIAPSKTLKTSSSTYIVPVWTDKAGQIGVLSDVDDTLTDSDIPHKLVAGYRTLFHSAYDVKVFPGAGKQLTSITAPVKGFPVRPLFFLTGSPWNLHTRIASAFSMAGVPKGAFILRRFSTESMKAYDFKHPHLQEVFKLFPQTKWVLFGDTGEQDPEVYLQMSKERPQQVEHIYIHNVATAHQDPQSPRFGWTNASHQAQRMTVFDNWNDLSGSIAQNGYVFGHAAAAATLKKTGTQ